MAEMVVGNDVETNSSGESRDSPVFKDPLGVNYHLCAAVDDESDEFDFDVRYISSITDVFSYLWTIFGTLASTCIIRTLQNYRTRYDDSFKVASVLVPTSSASQDLLLIQLLNKQQFSGCGACRHCYRKLLLSDFQRRITSSRRFGR